MDLRNDRDESLLVVLIALLALPTLGLGWVWLARTHWDLSASMAYTVRQVSRDPLALLASLHLACLWATGAVWVWRDGRRRGLGPLARLAWGLALLALGVLGVWIYLAVRPPFRREGCAS